MIKCSMDYKSLKFKIIIIFTMPTVALIYFSYSFITSKFTQYLNSNLYVLSAHITNTTSDLIHNIQIERGISAGYIVSKDTSIKEKLQKQYNLTDKAYQNFIYYINTVTSEKKDLYNILGDKNKASVKNIINQYNKINHIRQLVIKHHISFKEEIDYYENINKNLLNIVDVFMNYLYAQTLDSMTLSKLLYTKELMGLERAYIYNQILSDTLDQKCINKILNIQANSKRLKDEILYTGSLIFTNLYNSNIPYELSTSLKNLESDFLNNKLKKSDAQKWFNTSTLYINQLELITQQMLDIIIKDAKKVKEEAKLSLIITAILWVFSIFAFLFLIYILKRLIDKEESTMNELSIAAYTFDSHEAMTITDTNGTILKVNAAFSRITGYSASEVIGKNPRVLKSMKHPDEFYKEMWNKIHTEGQWSDEIYNKRKNGDIYQERLSITAIKNSHGITTNYIAQFLDISDLKEAQQRAEHQADHDSLTGLLNRKALNIRLKEEFVKARRHDFIHALLFIDLDHFKAVNDNYGHDIGDKLLIEVTKRIQSVLREEDIFSRISGDEFIVILTNIADDKEDAILKTKNKAHSLVKAIKKPFMINEHKINISSSIGIKIFPANEEDVKDVLIHADTAMYQAKHEGKNRYVFFDKTIELRLKQRNILEEEIKLGIKNDEFKFYLQPKTDVQTNEICGAEALIRWEHPTKGILYPEDFLDVIKDINLLPLITKKAITMVSKFLQEHSKVFKGTISINIHARELLEDDFLQNTLDIINKYNINPIYIELEILEDELIGNFEKTIIKINELKEHGISISIDDFGTGYSSITYLNKLPANNLKIDKYFIQNIDNNSNKELIKMIVKMANTFNMKSVIEGVESKHQLEFIKGIGANTYQGFYCSRAVPVESFLKLLPQCD